MKLGDKEFEQFVNVYMFRMRNLQPLHQDLVRLISEGYKARLLIETLPAAKPEYEDFVTGHGTPETDTEFATMFEWCFNKNQLLLRNYLAYILSIDHEIATVTLKWMNELKEYFDLTPKVVV